MNSKHYINFLNSIRCMGSNEALEPRLGIYLDSKFMYRFRRRALRYRAWQRLSRIKDRIWRTAEKVLKFKNSFAKSPLLISAIINIIFELAEKINSMKAMILKTGFLKAREMLEKYEKKGVFKWIPELKSWLKDSNYIEYLGITVRSSRWW